MHPAYAAAIPRCIRKWEEVVYDMETDVAEYTGTDGPLACALCRAKWEIRGCCNTDDTNPDYPLPPVCPLARTTSDTCHPYWSLLEDVAVAQRERRGITITHEMQLHRVTIKLAKQLLDTLRRYA